MKTAVIIANLGTPDSPERSDVKKYLSQFLNDPRVIDISPIGRAVLVNGLIVPFRSGKTSKLYKEVWTKDGSPLMVYGKQLEKLLQEKLGSKYDVALAMRYQSPGVEEVISKFNKPGYDKIVIFPLFPQYSSACNGSVNQEVMRIVSKWQVIPKIEFHSSYCNNEHFINAWKDVASNYNLKDYDHVLFSYHGLPERQMRKADYTGKHCLASDNCCATFTETNANCYRAQCYETTRHITKAINLDPSDFTVSFQSRLGRDPWIKPYTDAVLEGLAKEGKKKILVFAPAFVADCLETVYEISVEYQEMFEEWGGEKVQLVESLNAHPSWVDAIAKMIQN